MIACRSRSVLAGVKGSLERPACLLLSQSNFSTIAPLQRTAAPTEIDPAAREPGARLPLALQAIYYQPFRRVPTYGLPVCDLQLRSFSVRNLEFMCDFALRTAYYCHLPASGPVPLPKRTERWTVPKGHFVHKKSQENFERVTHKRLIQIKDGHPETVELWLAFLKKHQYYGVGMKANVWGFDELGVGKRMNVSLETLKDVPRPKWIHFGSRRTFETANKVREILASEGYKPLSAEPTQVDAALNQITDKEAVRARIKEILDSPIYRALVEKPEGVPAEEKLVLDKVMTEEESMQMWALKEALADADGVKKVAEVVSAVDVGPEDEVMANVPNEAIPTPAEMAIEAKATDEAVPEVFEATTEKTPIEVKPEVEDLAKATKEAAPEVEDLEKVTKEAASEVKDLEKVAEEAASEVEDLAKATEVAAPEVEDLEKATEEAAPEVEDLAKATKEAVPEVEDLEKVAEEAVSEVEDLAKATKEAAPEVEDLEKATEEAAPEVEDLEKATEGTASEVFEATTEKTQVEVKPEAEDLAKAPEEATPKAPVPTPEALADPADRFK